MRNVSHIKIPLEDLETMRQCEVAEKYGVSRPYVYTLCKKAGLIKPKKPEPLRVRDAIEGSGCKTNQQWIVKKYNLKTMYIPAIMQRRVLALIEAEYELFNQTNED